MIRPNGCAPIRSCGEPCEVHVDHFRLRFSNLGYRIASGTSTSHERGTSRHHVPAVRPQRLPDVKVAVR